MTLRDAVLKATQEKKALGHFNVSDSTQVNAIVATARGMSLPVIIGVSEGERKFFGVRAVAAMVDALRRDGAEVYLNADHTHDLEGIRTCIDMGFDAVLFDGSKLPFEENVRMTREAVAYARASGRDVLVEGELGYIGSSSALLDAIPEGAGLDMTTPEQAAAYVREASVDLLAPSVGNIHGMLKDTPDPRLDVARAEAIAHAAGVPLVLHGASGNSDEDIAGCIAAGVSIVHINTEIRAAYRTGIEAGLATHKDEVAPAKYFAQGVEEMVRVVRAKLALYNRHT